MSVSFGLASTQGALIVDHAEHRRAGRDETAELDVVDLRRRAGDRRAQDGMVEIALRLVERRLGLRIGRKFLDRQIGIAEQLVQSRIALLDGEFGLQLCGDDRGQSSVEIGLRAGLRTDQRGLALDVALLEVDVLLREFGECVQGLEIGLQLGEIGAHGVKLGFGLRERKRNGSRSI